MGGRGCSERGGWKRISESAGWRRWRESGRHLETFEYKRAAAQVAIAAVNKGASGMH